jgi:hypothetical protein
VKCFDVDAALDRADDLVEADVLLAREQRNVRHALELHVGPAFAYEQPCERWLPVMSAIQPACSRVV